MPYLLNAARLASIYNTRQSAVKEPKRACGAASDSWAKESFEIAVKIAYRNGGRIGTTKAGAMDCTMVAATPVLPAGYVVSASRIAGRRIVLAGYRWADLLARVVGN